MGTGWNTLDGAPTRVIAHRGASGYLPEHTAAAFRLGIEQGADAVEPDLVPSRDGVLVVRHDRGLAHSTDVAAHPEFGGRARVQPDGTRDWYVDEFTWAELETLRAVQPFPQRSSAHDGQERLLSFSGLLDLVAEAGAANGRRIPVIPELKHPGLFAGLGIDLIGAFVSLVRGHRERASVPAVLSFDLGPLERVRTELGLPVIAELEYEQARSLGRGELGWDGLEARFAGISVDKRALLSDSAGLQHIRSAHAHGLTAHAWTFRDDRLSPGFGSAAAEYEAAFALGVDYVFSDFPDTALHARARFRP